MSQDTGLLTPTQDLPVASPDLPDVPVASLDLTNIPTPTPDLTDVPTPTPNLPVTPPDVPVTPTPTPDITNIVNTPPPLPDTVEQAPLPEELTPPPAPDLTIPTPEADSDVAHVAINDSAIDWTRIPSNLHGPIRYLIGEFRSAVELELLRHWITLEQAWNDEVSITFISTVQSLIHLQIGSLRLATKHRPPQILQWSKERRRMGPNPKPTVTIRSFAPAMRAWWCQLQPEWRKFPGLDWPLCRDTPDDETWIEVRKGGGNGIVGVIVCLYWWREAARSSMEHSEYESVLEDVAWVLSQLTLLECQK